MRNLAVAWLDNIDLDACKTRDIAVHSATGANDLSVAGYVFENGPLNAQGGAKFVGLPNLLLTPHIAGVTDESNVRVSELIADTVIAHLEHI